MECELRKAHCGWRLSARVRLVVERRDAYGRPDIMSVLKADLLLAGVEDVKTDSSNNKLTVTGKVDPVKIKQRLEEKTRKKVEIVSPQHKKDAGAPAGDKQPKPDEKLPAEEKEDEKKPKQATVVLKIRLHCDGCVQKIRKFILKIEEVDSVSIDTAKDLVTVTGMVDEKELVPYLRSRLRRGVEVVPPPVKKDDSGPKKEDGKESGDGDKKGGKVSGGGGDKKEGKEALAPAGAVAAEVKGDGGEKEKSKDVKAEEPKMEFRRFEHHGYYPSKTSYWYDQGQSSHYYSHGYAVEPYAHHGSYTAPPPPPPPPGYPHMVHEGYSHYPPYPMDPRLHAPQMFSDENPNACSVM
ncbi:hypothetical protein SAY86_007449 [Trapa natans]|uniref:HMA domain-containing protein n=1 Tax=Trapa natans TaxID=22666 RepID=A0AAN7LDI3_TRANT|nr:hypothetical protein SAY86_007449 [Trapa natans]